jgi:rSAM/selenodomain-associated transferase 2
LWVHGYGIFEYKRTPMPSISVIVPVLNEELCLPALLDDLAALQPDQVIVVDGGSTDATVALAAPRATVIGGAPGRAAQMNAGAARATGDVLLFVHADARLGSGALDALRAAMRDDRVTGGAFDIRYEGGDLPARVFTSVNRLRRSCGIVYGDAGLFCRREVFERLGGYRAWPVMEDYEFARRMRRAGRMAWLDEPIRISDRRWRKAGLLRTLLVWALIQGLYSAGVSPHRLARLYPHIR